MRKCVFSFIFLSVNLCAALDSDGDKLKFDELGSLWEKLGGRFENDRSISSHSERVNNHEEDDQKKISLKEFLENYAKKHVKNDGDSQSEDSSLETSKLTKDKTNKSTWTLMDVQRHKHPFDDRNGWVSLDPIPWSVSKISKWQSKYKSTSERPWDEYGSISSSRPYYHEDDVEFNRPISTPSPYIYNRPSESSDRYDNPYNDDMRPNRYSSKPSAYFGNKVHLQAHYPGEGSGSTSRPYYHNKKDCNNPQHHLDDIITDGRPSNFPHSNPYDSFRRRGSEIDVHSESSPLNGEGEWVLLSTTKGYKPMRNRQRSLSLPDDEPNQHVFRASRGVRLTVLPPLKGKKMTTSHGGLLQVESTVESVEEAKQNFDKKQQKLKIKRKRRKTLKKAQETAKINEPRAVMAAVGAGMIPATMAMMMPMAISG